MRQKRAAFPVGLYGMLLFALCWLTLPAVFAPVERVLVGACCLLPHAMARWSGTPVAAAAPEHRQRLRDLALDLAQRGREHDVGAARSLLPAAAEPLHCAVIACERRGGGGQPSELRLDHSYAELAGCSEFVTKGDALLGLLQRPGIGVAADDEPGDAARVLLLNHTAARPVYASMPLPEGGTLRLVVRAAATVDPAPLRVESWDNPYTAARLDRSGQPVHTLPLPSVPDQPPAGLWLGRTRIWGYEGEQGQDSLTIGVFVVPPIEPRALSHVVLWRTATADARPPEGTAGHGRWSTSRAAAATLWDLPGAAFGRHLLVAGERIPDGAAVVEDGLCLGTARGLSFGMGLVTSFVASRHRWSLVLLPADPAGRPRELTGEVVSAEGSVAWLRWRGDSFGGENERLTPGYLFTGSNGEHCPSGLLLGSAVPHPFERDLLQVTVPVEPGPRQVQVVVGGVGP